MECLRGLVLKSKFFANYLKEIISFSKYNELQFVNKCQNLTVNGNFLCQESSNEFFKKFRLKIIVYKLIFWLNLFNDYFTFQDLLF